MAFFGIDDTRLYYRILGSGPPLVLLMGFSGNSDWWPPQLLEALATRHQVILLDNRGAGRSELGRQTYTIPLLAADTIALLDALEIERAHLFGVSMGGMIAQEIALRYPRRLGKLILGCTTCGLLSAPFSVNHLNLVKAYLSQKRVRARPLSSNLVFSPDFLARHPEKLHCFQQRVQIAPMPIRIKIRQLAALFCFNSYLRLPRIRASTLVLTGSADCLVAPRNSQILARRIAASRLVILDGCGHGFMVEAEAPSARYILNFLAAPKGSPSSTPRSGYKVPMAGSIPVEDRPRGKSPKAGLSASGCQPHPACIHSKEKNYGEPADPDPGPGGKQPRPGGQSGQSQNVCPAGRGPQGPSDSVSGDVHGAAHR